MGIATLIADRVAIDASHVHNIAASGNLTDKELCKWLRKMLNQASKDLTVEIKAFEISD